MKPYRVPFHIRFNRFFMRPVFRALFHILGQIKISGAEHVPIGTPYVAAINHISIFDPPLAVAFWREEAEIVGAADVFAKKGQGPILKMYGVIPVHRGDYDRVLLETMLAILKVGRPFIIAPEGGRSHAVAMQRALPGIGYVIEHAAVPVIPVGLVGTTDDFWQRAKRGEKPLLEMRIGKPICFPRVTQTGKDRREIRQHNADLVMRHIAGLLPEEYHGVYARQAIYPA